MDETEETITETMENVPIVESLEQNVEITENAEREVENVAENVAEVVAQIVDETIATGSVEERVEEAPVEAEEIREEQQEDVSMDIEESNDEADEEEQKKKSLELKISFLDVLNQSEKIKDVLADLKVFISNEDVLEHDREEVEQLVAARVAKEKAIKKRLSKQKKGEDTAPEEPVKPSTGGIDFSVLFNQPSGIPSSSNENADAQAVNVHGTMLHTSTPIMSTLPPDGAFPGDPTIIVPIVSAPSVRVIPPVPFPSSQPIPPTHRKLTVNHGSAGFATPHPQDVAHIPSVLLPKTLNDVAPIPLELRGNLVDPAELIPVPDALLPPEKRKNMAPSAPNAIYQVKRLTLRLAGARPRERLLKRIEEEKKKEEAENQKKSKKDRRRGRHDDDFKKDTYSDRKSNKEGEKDDNKRLSDYRRARKEKRISGVNQGGSVLHRNSPLAVKRYHARQLAKEIGISIEQAMQEIEEQCEENPPPAATNYPIDPPSAPSSSSGRRERRESPEAYDHSRGIPGIDRPPQQRKRRGGVKNREKRERARELERGRGGDRGGRREGGGGRDDWGGRPQAKYAKQDDGYSNDGYGDSYGGYDEQGRSYEDYYNTHDDKSYDQSGYDQSGYDQNYEAYDGNYDYYQGNYEGYDQGYYEEGGKEQSAAGNEATYSQDFSNYSQGEASGYQASFGTKKD